MNIQIYQVDAFAQRPFEGNPAAVCPLDHWIDDRMMQAIAAENNLSETAFFVPDGDTFQLRWFTPRNEVDLCGHATLATASVIFDHLHPNLEKVSFASQSGKLTVKRDGDRLQMDFPSRPPKPCDPPPGLIEALGVEPEIILASRDHMAVFRDQSTIRSLAPDLTAIEASGIFGLIVSAPGAPGHDVVSRFFAPSEGVPEDPVTGSAHCTIVPYWSERLGRDELFCHQASARGGDLWCRLAGDRVLISGHAVTVLIGELLID